MRYAIIGDVHGNVFALDAVLEAVKARMVDAFLFVGDAIGYGPDPVACLERLLMLHEEGRLAWVVGNHELYVRGDLLPTGYSKEARLTLDWTRKQLHPVKPLWKFLTDAHLTAEINGMIWMTHDSMSEPGSVGYHRWAQNAARELKALRESGGVVCFYGHTHKMRAEILRGGNRVVLTPTDAHLGEGIDPRPLRFEADDIGWIGAGSVGIPVNASRAADYLILDDTAWTVEKYGAVYARDKARQRTVEILSEPCGQDVAERIARWM
jgi:predicted phosphodiesterase